MDWGDLDARPEAAVTDITVLVADAQRLFADALITALSRQPDLRPSAECPTTGPATIQLLGRLRPDVALVDYWMPAMEGPAVTRAAASSSPRTKVLLLSWLHGPIQIREALASGAAGFLPKSIGLDELEAAIRRAHQGEPLVYGPQLAKLAGDIEARYQDASEQTGRLDTLSPREVEVLQLLGDGRTPHEIAEALFISQGTVKNHIHRILRKTGAQSQLEAVAMARRALLIQDRHYPGPNRPRLQPPSRLPAESF
ncbi:MAG: LuxR C-terminal-related transcriptional regulator [Acidimicrobiales bacterium]